MFDMMNMAKNAIESYNAALQVHTANIANLNVTGYKALTISFQSILDKVMSPGSAAGTFSNLGGTNPRQGGQGVGIANTSIDFTQGSALSSNQNADLYISGSGLLVVSDDDGATYQYTRAGDFSISSGSLVTSTGMQVYGLTSSGTLTAITGLPGAITDYSWNDGTGELLYGGSATSYRIALTYFPNQGGLTQASGTTFKESIASGSAATPIAPGGAAGTITHGQLEQSNVFYYGESIDSLEIQRAMSANLTSVKAISDLISQFTSKLG